MQDCATPKIRFETPTALALEAAFDGGRLTSDGGLCWLAKMDSEMDLSQSISECVPEWRTRRGHHTLLALVKQRLYQIACGYEDQNDSNSLREDPLLKLVCGSMPESGADLASQPTICRLENAANRRSCYRIAQTLFELYLRERGKDGTPKKILLDFDSTDDPTHGDQEGSYYHGYYEQHMYHPLLVFDGESGHLITAILRADAGFAVPALYEYCEKEGLDYTVGLITNPRLEAIAEGLLAEAKDRYEAKGEKAKLFSEDAYEAGSWGRKRRVVYKAEAMEQGTNTRFIVTSSASGPKELYEWYVRRGESENWIKDFKLALKADRLSCHRFIANQFRLLLHAAAYWLLDMLRRKLCESGVERLQLDTLRLRVIKIGGRVRELLARVKLHLASGHPGQPLWHTLATSAALS